MIGKIQCRICGDWHKATSAKFPQQLFERQKVEILPGEFELIRVLVGHVCKKCLNKVAKITFMKQHNIAPDISGGRTLREIIKGTIEKIKFGK